MKINYNTNYYVHVKEERDSVTLTFKKRRRWYQQDERLFGYVIFIEDHDGPEDVIQCTSFFAGYHEHIKPSGFNLQARIDFHWERIIAQQRAIGRALHKLKKQK